MAYLKGVQAISINLCSLFEKLVYFVVGLPSNLVCSLESMNQNSSDIELQVFNRLRAYRETNIEFMETALPTFRLFLLKAIPQMILENSISFRNRFMETFLYLIRETFTKTRSLKFS